MLLLYTFGRNWTQGVQAKETCSNAFLSVALDHLSFQFLANQKPSFNLAFYILDATNLRHVRPRVLLYCRFDGKWAAGPLFD